MIDEWYSPKEIEFTDRQHIDWLVEQLPSLKAGFWPKQPSSKPEGIAEDGKPPTKAHIKPRAYFVTPIQFAAEVECRLEACGIDGLITKAIRIWNESEESIGKHLRMSPEVIRFRVEATLTHITGYRRKRYYDRSRVLR